jgi:CspA family cold shock protein
MATTCTGKIKFVSEKGFLFLVPDSAGPDVFGHVAEWERRGLREPEVGQRYEFELVQKPKGPQAINPRPVL